MESVCWLLSLGFEWDIEVPVKINTASKGLIRVEVGSFEDASVANSGEH